MFAAVAKLRRVGPSVSAIGAYCIVKPSTSCRGGDGEKCLQSQAVRDAGTVWAGGLHSGWNARKRRSVAPVLLVEM